MKKTLLSEEPFGISAMNRLKVGDLVQWSELAKGKGYQSYENASKVGIISELFLEKRGNREVAVAKVHEIDNKSQLGTERNVLAINLSILSRAGEENE